MKIFKWKGPAPTLPDSPSRGQVSACGSSPAPELTGFSLEGNPAGAETPRAAHLSAHVGAFLFKDQGQVLVIVSCKEPIDLLQPVRDNAGSHSLQLVTMKQNCG